MRFAVATTKLWLNIPQYTKSKCGKLGLHDSCQNVNQDFSPWELRLGCSHMIFIFSKKEEIKYYTQINKHAVYTRLSTGMTYNKVLDSKVSCLAAGILWCGSLVLHCWIILDYCCCAATMPKHCLQIRDPQYWILFRCQIYWYFTPHLADNWPRYWHIYFFSPHLIAEIIKSLL